MTILCVFINSMGIFAQDNKKVSAVWIATVYNTDFPKVKNNADAQKKEFIDYLDKLKDLGINTVVVQVRPKSDALYKSNINPWSDVLTGVQGKDPGYDPMKFMISEAHKRGMDFHAWLNPYRITTKGTDLNTLCENHPARKNPDWVISYNDALYYNPELSQVKDYIASTVKEIVDNYEVDAIHFDDYFYPSNYPLPEGEDKDGAIANERRQHVNDMVSQVSRTIKASNPNVEFGISPVGIWKNDYSGKFGSIINGYEGYYSVYGDAISWIDNGWVDYIAPQVYWEIGNKAADYETMIKWWSNAVKGTEVKLYIGEGIYKDVVSKEIVKHLELCDSIDEIKGNFFFSLKDILNNRLGVANNIGNYYKDNGSNQGTNVPENKPVDSKKYEAIYNSAIVTINGKSIPFESYNIDGYNYFKLRDIAFALNNTENKFDTAWDENSQSINLITGSLYNATGGELDKGDGKNKTAASSTAKLMKNGELVEAQAYNINGNNYFKLRDLGDILSFGVIWNDKTRTIEILTLN